MNEDVMMSGKIKQIYGLPYTEDNFIRTYSGRKFWPLNPEPESIAIQDIAHALSLICRWTGHTYCFYSVAEHSLRVSKLAEEMALSTWRYGDQYPKAKVQAAREAALWGLLHDASEAYLCDVPTPLKRTRNLGGLYVRYEGLLMTVIAERFNLVPAMPDVVKEADRVLLSTEARDLMGVSAEAAEEWRVTGGRLTEVIRPMDAQKSEAEFLQRFEVLTTGGLGSAR